MLSAVLGMVGGRHVCGVLVLAGGSAGGVWKKPQTESEDHTSYPGLGAQHSASWDLVSSSAKDFSLLGQVLYFILLFFNFLKCFKVVTIYLFTYF